MSTHIAQRPIAAGPATSERSARRAREDVIAPPERRSGSGRQLSDLLRSTDSEFGVTADLERPGASLASPKYRVENRPELYGKRRRGIPELGRVPSVLVAGHPTLLDELAPFAARKQLRRALDIARAADLAEILHQNRTRAARYAAHYAQIKDSEERTRQAARAGAESNQP